MQHVERRATRAGEHAQIERRPKAAVLAVVQRLTASPVRRREEDAVGDLAARRGKLGERARNRVERTRDLVGPRAQIREDALCPGEPLEDAEGREDGREERRLRQDLADQTKPVEQLAERRLAHRLAADAGPVLGLRDGVPHEPGTPIATVAVARAPRLRVVMRPRIELDEVELMPLGEGDRRFGELRRAFVLVRIEVPPHRERDAIDVVAGQRECHALS